VTGLDEERAEAQIRRLWPSRRGGGEGKALRGGGGGRGGGSLSFFSWGGGGDRGPPGVFFLFFFFFFLSGGSSAGWRSAGFLGNRMNSAGDIRHLADDAANAPRTGTRPTCSVTTAGMDLQLGLGDRPTQVLSRVAPPRHARIQFPVRNFGRWRGRRAWRTKARSACLRGR